WSPIPCRPPGVGRANKRPQPETRIEPDAERKVSPPARRQGGQRRMVPGVGRTTRIPGDPLLRRSQGMTHPSCAEESYSLANRAHESGKGKRNLSPQFEEPIPFLGFSVPL